MSLSNKTADINESSGIFKAYAAEALAIFDSECRKEAEEGRSSLTSTVKIRSKETNEIIPLVLKSIDEAEKVKNIIMNALIHTSYLRAGAMVFKDGPYYHTPKRRIRLKHEDSQYFLIKIKISASW